MVKKGGVKAVLPDQMRLELADDILTGRIKPGARLSEQHLAERFGVSRTPVREALKQLAATGLVESRPHCGVVVVAIPADHLGEMFELVADLEAICARNAAMRMTPQERRALQVIHEHSRECVLAGDFESYDAINLSFHEAILKGAHNRYLSDCAFAARARIAPFRRAQFRLLGRLSQSFVEHDAIMDAIHKGDGGGAASLMLKHVAASASASDKYLSAMPGLLEGAEAREERSAPETEGAKDCTQYSKV
ncbi:GntR family transcriptional regulator [Telmatospirillum sp. J64-1]|uniref:GntR family transcriptional regulator n=1 Tax=Telmatospirillum sp. J64-1 TaxID=2502183 RepID=UPI00115EA5D4|nr:GntR family transcriptional regulator [Telmatospirillum sp. J64-1]